MKAFILAAGLGTRLRPLGLSLPKVMMPVGGRPLLEHHVDLFRRHGIRELIVNLHHRPDAIVEYFGDGSRFGVSLTYSFERKLLGTAGGVRKMAALLRGGTFIVFYGDNLVRTELGPLLAFHRDHEALVTIALFRSDEPWSGGMVETDEDGRVLRFVEKPAPHTVSTDLSSAGIFIAEPAMLSEIPPDRPCDFGHDLFPALLAGKRRVFARLLDGYLQDIGTPERLAKAQRAFEAGLV